MSSNNNLPPPNNDWCTPEEILTPVRQLFGGTIDLDPCSNEFSIVNARRDYQLEERGEDGLALRWFGRVYVNPPYTPWTLQEKFIWRCAEAHLLEGAEVVLLIPNVMETGRYHDCIFPSASAICQLDGRVQFLEPPPRQRGRTDEEYAQTLRVWQHRGRKVSPTMGCSLIYWGPAVERFFTVFTPLGFCQDLVRDRLRQRVRYDVGAFWDRLLRQLQGRCSQAASPEPTDPDPLPLDAEFIAMDLAARALRRRSGLTLHERARARADLAVERAMLRRHWNAVASGRRRRKAA